jgi:hypothetical protein
LLVEAAIKRFLTFSIACQVLLPKSG